VVATALEAGYRSIDTAAMYRNEDGVGRAVAASGIARDELFVTTKLDNPTHRSGDAERAFEQSLQRLGLDCVDLYLIHWPLPAADRYVQVWSTLAKFAEDGRARAIGVSNFQIAHLQRLLDETEIVPAVNQVELHPYFPQQELLRFHAEHDIVTEAWSPLGKNSPVLSERVIAGAAAAHGVTPAQVVLRWHVQLGSVPLPKSSSPERQRENLDLFGFELTDDEMAAITALGRSDGRLFDGDPNHHEEQ
jgi:diketogulonate reductase-like aldo/keto reductase